MADKVDLINELNKRFSQEIETNENIIGIDITTNLDSFANNIEYIDRYQADLISSSAISNANLPAPTRITRNKAENRISKIEDRMGIFLYNLFPYGALQSISNLGSLNITGSSNITRSSLINTAMTSLDGLAKLKYFTPGELALTLSHNFYTLHFLRGITIKKGKKGAFGIPAIKTDIWTGQTDLFYGRGSEVTLGGIGSRFFAEVRDIPDSSNASLGQLKQEISPNTRIGHGVITTIKKQSYVDQLSTVNPMITETRNDLFKGILKDQVSEIEGFWSRNENTKTFAVEQQQYRKREEVLDNYIINKDVNDIIQRTQTWTGKDDKKDVTTEEFDLKQAKFRNHEKNSSEYLIDKNVLNITQRTQTWTGKDDKKDVTTEEFDLNDVKNRNHEKNSSEYLIDKNVLNITQRTQTWEGQVDTKDVVTEDFDFNDVKNRNHEKNSSEYIIDPDVTKISQRVNIEGNDFKWKKQLEEEGFEYRDIQFRNPSPVSDRTINSEVNRIELMINPAGDNNEENLNVGELEEKLREKTFIKNKENKWQLGAIRVMPVVAEQYNLNLPNFYIPFEFNPDISENNVEARYTQTQVLSRIGDLQSYTGTGSLSVSITSKYFAVSHDGKNGESTGNNWMSEFTLEKIQAIELAYRSLVYPHYPDEADINQGYKYVKPPLIKVVLGNSDDATAPYANLLTYQNETIVKNRLKSAENYGGNILRTFVATSVTIKKDLNATPIYIDEHRTIRDTFGFEVSLNLIEVAPNYIDSMPDFRNYFNQYSSIEWKPPFVGNQPTAAQQQNIADLAAAGGNR